MHINLYLDDQTGMRLQALAARRGESRNALIRQALKEWIELHSDKAGWPPEIMAFGGMSEIEPFESTRRLG